MRIRPPTSASPASTFNRVLTDATRAVANGVARKLVALDAFTPAKTREAVPLPPGRPLAEYDGAFVGADGNLYPPGTRLEEVPGRRPENGQAPKGKAIFVNGVSGKPDGVSNYAQLFANKNGMEVVPLYNATQGWWNDALQTVLDQLDRGTNKAANSLSGTVYDRLKAGDPVHLVAHSQGALITSRALQDVKDRLVREGMSQGQVEALLARVTVETFGGAARSYPDGPRYVHYVNRADPVTLVSGWALGTNGPGVHPGRGAKVVQFWDWSLKPSSHDPQTYLKRYQPLA